MKKYYFLTAMLFFAVQMIFPNELLDCTAPVGLSATNISQTGAYLYLTPTSSNTGTFNIRYHGGTTTTWTTVEHITLPFQLGSLSCGTTYEWQAQLVCADPTTGTTTVTAWSTGAAFTTLACSTPACNAPTNLVATNVSQTGAYLYAGTAVTTGLYNIRYHGGNTTAWTTLEHVSMPYQLGNLTCGTVYEWQAQLVCPNSATGVSDWATGAVFTTLACTPPACNTPIGLSATNVSQTGAYLYLMPSSSNNGTFNIRYHGGTTTTWTVLEHVTLPYQLGSLTCGTTYEWQAQLVCSNSAGTATVTGWSTGAAFTTLACSPPPCATPSALVASNITQTGASIVTLSATPVSGIFNIRYHSGNVTTWTVVEHVTLPYQLSNLNCGTTYEWQAQQICSDPTTNTTALSDWFIGNAFTTLACTPPPTCNAPTGLSATNISQTGAYLYLNPTSSNTGTFNIRYHGGSTTTWMVLEHVTLPYQLVNLTCGTTYEWQAQLVCPNSTPAVSDWSTGATFTTLACTPPPTCNAPTGLGATNISQTGAYLYAGIPTVPLLCNIRYHGGNTTTWTVVEHVTLPYQLGSLTCGTTYEWQAQAICSNTATGTTMVSDWSTGAAFTTLACTPPPTCNAPTGLSATNISQTGVYLYLNPTSSNTGTFNIRYHGGTTTTWMVLEHVTLPYQLGNLNCGTTYEWQAQLVCPNLTPAVSDWSTGATFTTLACAPPPTCNAPTGLAATNITQTGAVLSAGTTAVALQYNIRYHGGNTTTWTVFEHVTLPYQLGNLTCGTTYEWQAQLICSNSATGAVTVSDWSTGAVFTTLACTPPPTCNAPTGLSATNISQTGAYLYLTPTSTNVGTFNIRYHGGNTTTWTVIEHVTLPYQLGNLTCGTTYEWQAQLVCPNSTAGVSAWSTGAAFTTLACTPPPTCNAPIGLTATNISQTGAYLYLSPTSSNTGTFNIRYHGPNSTTWIVIEHVTLPYQLGNLACGTGYEWQAQLICANNPAGTIGVSAWSAGATFNTLACTPPGCNAPTALSANNISQTSATLHWESVAGAVAYIVYYKKANFPTLTYTTVNATTNSIVINGLNGGTAYVWQVQAICGSTASNSASTSPMSVTAVFLTTGTLVFPNPANQSVGVTFWANNASRMRVELRNSYGQLVYSEVRENAAGTNDFTIDTSEFSAGLYFLTLQANGVNSTSKVVIKH